MIPIYKYKENIKVKQIGFGEKSLKILRLQNLESAALPFQVKTNKSLKMSVISTCTYVCVLGGKKCSFFGKFGVLCFLETPVLRFALLAYYRQKLVNTLLNWNFLHVIAVPKLSWNSLIFIFLLKYPTFVDTMHAYTVLCT